ncbi:hypothetical protein [Burkholderia pseudomallei]|uniref:hypothetical protein n=1 Tax=Burkholderia pseudomallei TaxID=28450 RepID=UPI0009B1F226|nr:hypothetical protein [Burkholderia pseudomallei]
MTAHGTARIAIAAARNFQGSAPGKAGGISSTAGSPHYAAATLATNARPATIDAFQCLMRVAAKRRIPAMIMPPCDDRTKRRKKRRKKRCWVPRARIGSVRFPTPLELAMPDCGVHVRWPMLAHAQPPATSAAVSPGTRRSVVTSIATGPSAVERHGRQGGPDSFPSRQSMSGDDR